MLSTNEYNLLKSIKQTGTVSSEGADEHASLWEAGLIANAVIELNGMLLTDYNKYAVTPTGEAALEEYERMLKKQTQEEETLKVARKSNIISIVSLCVSSLFSIPALVVAIVSLIQ